MAALVGALSGGVSVATDIISNTLLTWVTPLTTQRDLLVMIVAALLVILLFVEQLLTTVFAESDVLSPVIERVILHFVTLPKLAFLFVLLRLLMSLATEFFETSVLRWNDGVVALILIFSVFFLVIERAAPPAVAAVAAVAAKAAN